MLLSGIHHPVSGIRLNIKNEWNIVETTSAKQHAFGYRFYPDKLKGEGFFIAAFKKSMIQRRKKKKSNFEKSAIGKSTIKKSTVTSSETELLQPMIKNAGSFSFLKWQDTILAIPASLMNDVLHLQSLLYIKKAGVKTGTVIRNELLPDHELALSGLLTPAIASVKVDKETALQYLRRAEINIKTEHKGWVLLEFDEQALGWVKILPNRINNYYPKDWRILNK